MKYIIAPYRTVTGEGWRPASRNVVNGRVVLNENELRYRYPGMTLAESAAAVGGIIVPRTAALDYLLLRKTFEQIKEEEQ